MADASRDIPPSGWSDAFAALPMASPAESRWTAIEAALDGAVDAGRHGAADAPRPGLRRLAWVAAAAAIAVFAFPVALWLRSHNGDTPSRSPFTAPTPSIASAARDAPTTNTPATEPSRVPTPTLASVIDPAADMPPTTPNRAIRMRPASVRTARSEASVPDRAIPSRQAKAWPRARVAADEPSAATMQAAFEPYYLEAARLESVIAAARDPRVGSGPGASLAGALDGELAAIDARLAQPGLDASRRLALWRDRVDLLRASAEFESQLRLLAAEGAVLDGALVRVD